MSLWYSLKADSSSSKPDRVTLLAFFDATNGSEWKAKSGWGTDIDIMYWHGVGVDIWGRVNSLELPGNGLTGAYILALFVLVVHLRFLMFQRVN